jgi:hypothetical protein
MHKLTIEFDGFLHISSGISQVEFCRAFINAQTWAKAGAHSNLL